MFGKRTVNEPYSVFVKKLTMMGQSVVKVKFTNGSTMTVDKGKTADMVNKASAYAKTYQLKLE